MKRAFTLIEALIALLLLTITVVGSMALYFYSDESMAIATHRRMATDLANSELENLKNAALDPTYYDGLVSISPEDVSIGDLMQGEKELIIENGPEPTVNKKVTIRITWNEAASKDTSIIQTLDLVSYIAKRL